MERSKCDCIRARSSRPYYNNWTCFESITEVLRALLLLLLLLSTHEKNLIKIWPILVMQFRKSRFFFVLHMVFNLTMEWPPMHRWNLSSSEIKIDTYQISITTIGSHKGILSPRKCESKTTPVIHPSLPIRRIWPPENTHELTGE